MEAAQPAIAGLKLSPRKLIKWGGVFIVVSLAVIYGYRYWRHSKTYVSTDDAYVNAHTVEVAAEVAGQISRLYVQDNQQVRAGDPLFDIDVRPYQAALAKANAQLELARQQAQ